MLTGGLAAESRRILWGGKEYFRLDTESPEGNTRYMDSEGNVKEVIPPEPKGEDKSAPKSDCSKPPCME